MLKLIKGGWILIGCLFLIIHQIPTVLCLCAVIFGVKTDILLYLEPFLELFVFIIIVFVLVF